MLHHKDLSGLEGQEHLHLPLDVQPQRFRVNHDYPMRFVLSELRGHCPGLAGLSAVQKHAKALHAWLVALFVPVHSCSK